MWETVKNFKYIKEVAFIFAIILLIGAWKFGTEALGE